MLGLARGVRSHLRTHLGSSIYKIALSTTLRGNVSTRRASRVSAWARTFISVSSCFLGAGHLQLAVQEGVYNELNLTKNFSPPLWSVWKGFMMHLSMRRLSGGFLAATSPATIYWKGSCVGLDLELVKRARKIS